MNNGWGIKVPPECGGWVVGSNELRMCWEKPGPDWRLYELNHPNDPPTWQRITQRVADVSTESKQP